MDDISLTIMKRQQHFQGAPSKRHCPASPYNGEAQGNWPLYSQWSPNNAQIQTCDPSQITKNNSSYDNSTANIGSIPQFAPNSTPNGYCSPMTFTTAQLVPMEAPKQLTPASFLTPQFTGYNNGPTTGVAYEGYVNSFHYAPSHSCPTSTTPQIQQNRNVAYQRSQHGLSQQSWESQQYVPDTPSVRLPFAMNRESGQQIGCNIPRTAPFPIPPEYQPRPYMLFNRPNRPAPKDVMGLDMANYSKPQKKRRVPKSRTTEPRTPITELNKPPLPTPPITDPPTVKPPTPTPTPIREVEKPTNSTPTAEQQDSTNVPETEFTCAFTAVGLDDDLDFGLGAVREFLEAENKRQEEEKRKADEEQQKKEKETEEEARKFREMIQSASYQPQYPKAASVNPISPEPQSRDKDKVIRLGTPTPKWFKKNGAAQFEGPLVAYAVPQPDGEGVGFKVVKANSSILEIMQAPEISYREIQVGGNFSGMTERAVTRWCHYLLKIAPGVDDAMIVWAK
ncbi:hypothetical protein RRF57_000889 [Xylaria bambusicola]|uniref:Uncharacterized protein n=1 Tax=Xylaria bambusicola TaxID=326684 RepID=A0AAN7UBJ3_9PEZI